MRPSRVADPQTGTIAGRAVGSTLVAALLLTLAACSGDDADEPAAEPPPSSSPPPATPVDGSAEEEPEEPPTPPVAADTRHAREAFVRFVVDAWGYALRHNDPSVVTDLSPRPKQPCAGCPELAQELARRSEDGWHVDFPGAEVRRVRLAPGSVPGTVLGTATIDVPASVSYFDDGSVRNTNEEHRGTTFEVLTRRDGEGFALLGFQVR
ncbi:hypothetical protein [Nocardioides caldifontis]|uniref:hypothetical protein n=1 Tax=Nocardioides caldifontis TaxID=2588938 RepID=UPI0011E02152|nr:hypothetical protein [Nocardioides caldifontis]